jgi:serine phosphatase RsbU (regulator of sigma subunit)
MFGMERLQGTLHRLAGLGSAAAVLQGVNAAVAGFIGGRPLADDVTVMCVTVTA